jgi:exodeoxyribonuclease VIII
MNRFNDVMIDLETLNTTPDSVILVIAAVKFSRRGKELSKDLPFFYKKVTIQSCLDKGLTISKDTQDWWDKQDPEIRKEAFGEPRVDLKTALVDFKKWIGKEEYIWSHGSSFDIVILNEALRRCGLKSPWKFWNHRDTRTLFDVAGIKNSDLPQGDKHNALADCHRQIAGVNMAYTRLRDNVVNNL